jgi:hypothetical protein
MVRDFDDNEFPLAYLISFRCYGTWMHGDPRRSVDRKHNVYGTPKIEPNPRLQRSDMQKLKHPPIGLSARQRPVVERAVREVCDHRRYILRAINVRTNHVHTVVTAAKKPEPT